jgi:hypothetical protein
MFGHVGVGGILHHDGGGGPDGAERANGEGGLQNVRRRHHDDAPDVTVADEELPVGVVVDVAPVLPVFPVLPVVPVVPESEEFEVVPDEELPVLVVRVEFDDEEVASAAVPAAWAPEWSWATTTPRATVAPVAATMAPRVRNRSREWALSLSAGVLGWAGSGMWGNPRSGTAPSHHARFDTSAGPAVESL